MIDPVEKFLDDFANAEETSSQFTTKYQRMFLNV